MGEQQAVNRLKAIIKDENQPVRTRAKAKLLLTKIRRVDKGVRHGLYWQVKEL